MNVKDGHFTTLTIETSLSIPSSPLLPLIIGRAGALVYNMTDNTVYVSNGLAWVPISSGGGSGNITFIPTATVVATPSVVPVGGSVSLNLAPSGVTAGTYGTSTTVPSISVTSEGLIDNAADVSIAPITMNPSLPIQSSPSVAPGGTLSLSMAPSGVTAGTYGTSTTVPSISVTSEGLIDNAADVSIAPISLVSATPSHFVFTTPSVAPGDVLTLQGVSTPGLAGTYGTASKIPAITVDPQGFVTAASEIDAEFSVTTDSNLQATPSTVPLGTTLDLKLVDQTLTPGSYGSTTNIPVVTVNQQGVVTGITDVVLPPATGSFSVTANDGLSATTPVSLGGNLTLGINDSGATAGTYGSNSRIPVVSVNTKGFVTSITDVAIAGGGGGSFNVVGNSPVDASPATVSIGGTLTIGLIDQTLTPGSYGSTTTIPSFSVTQKGIISGISDIPATFNTTGTGGVTVSASTITLGGTLTIGLTDQVLTPSTYGDGSNVPVVTVNQKGVITGISTTPVIGGGSGSFNVTVNDGLTTTTPTVSTASGTLDLGIANSGVTAGTYGSSVLVPQITVDAKGFVTSVVNVGISGGGGGSFTVSTAGGVTTTTPVVSLGGNLAIDVQDSGVVAGTYGSATAIPSFSVNQKGFVTSVTDIPANFNVSGVNGVVASPSTVALGGTLTVGLPAQSLTPGTYGNATSVSQVTVNDRGIITNIANVPISLPSQPEIWKYLTDPSTGLTTCINSAYSGSGPSNLVFPLPYTSTESVGTFMMFDRAKGAFRAGNSGPVSWLNASRGTNSVCFGNANRAAAASSAVIGGDNNAVQSTGQASSIGGGTQNNIVALYSFIGAGTSNTCAGAASGNEAVVAGELNNVSGYASIIGAGSNNTCAGQYSIVGAGQYNSCNGTNSAIVGGGIFGAGNTCAGSYSIVGSGQSNSCAGSFSMIGGGSSNSTALGTNYGFIGAGQTLGCSGSFSAIVSGSSNQITAGTYNFIGCGSGHSVSGAGGSDVNYCFIGGGVTNTITGTSIGPKSIVGGGNNRVDGGYSIIGGGRYNLCSAPYSFIGGGGGTTSGLGNVISSSAGYSFIGGGTTNTLTGAANFCFIGGGVSNDIINAYSAIVAGQNGTVNSEGAFIGAGTGNSIAVTSLYSFIGAGQNNSAAAGNNSFIGAGQSNGLSSSSTASAIVAGASNTCTAPNSFVGSGSSNAVGSNNSFIGSGQSNSSASSANSFIGSGQNNVLSTNATGSAIVAGAYNSCTSPYSFIGSGGALVALNANKITANLGYSFIGAGNNNEISGLVGVGYSFVGAGSLNKITAANSGIVAGGGIQVAGPYSFVGAGSSNSITSGNYVFIGAGSSNSIAGDQSGVAAGTTNSITTTNSFIGAGEGNKIEGTGSFVGSGNLNVCKGIGSSIACGTTNSIAAACQYGFIGAGDSNTVNTSRGFIGAGISNIVSGTGGAVVAGSDNKALGTNSVVVGGQTNTASGAISFAGGGSCTASNTYSFAFGSGCTSSGVLGIALGGGATCSNNYSFIWNDNATIPVSTTADRQFMVGCTGGARFRSNAAGTTGVALNPGGSSWAAISDINAKENLIVLEPVEVLKKVDELPIYQYNYKGSDPELKCIGPVAQDWHKLFPSAKDPLTIETMDLEGVSLASIKGLLQMVKEQQAQLQKQEERIAALEAKLASV